MLTGPYLGLSNMMQPEQSALHSRRGADAESGSPATRPLGGHDLEGAHAGGSLGDPSGPKSLHLAVWPA